MAIEMKLIKIAELREKIKVGTLNPRKGRAASGKSKVGGGCGDERRKSGTSRR
jgi:hypothetical protein